MNHQKFMYFHHYVPWTRIPDNMSKSNDYRISAEPICGIKINQFLKKKISGKVLTDKKKTRQNGVSQTPQSRKVSVSGAVHSRDHVAASAEAVRGHFSYMWCSTTQPRRGLASFYTRPNISLIKVVWTCPHLFKLVWKCSNLSRLVQTCLNLFQLV